MDGTLHRVLLPVDTLIVTWCPSMSLGCVKYYIAVLVIIVLQAKTVKQSGLSPPRFAKSIHASGRVAPASPEQRRSFLP